VRAAPRDVQAGWLALLLNKCIAEDNLHIFHQAGIQRIDKFIHWFINFSYISIGFHSFSSGRIRPSFFVVAPFDRDEVFVLGG